MPPIKIKLLRKEAKIPEYSYDGDSCVDIVGLDYFINDDFKFVEFSTGIALEIPKGYVGLLYPRSSISQTSHQLCNSVGIIDENFRGEIKVRFRFDESRDWLFYNYGDRICQLMVVPYDRMIFEKVEQLSETERGQKGFGSSNEKE